MRDEAQEMRALVRMSKRIEKNALYLITSEVTIGFGSSHAITLLRNKRTYAGGRTERR